MKIGVVIGRFQPFHNGHYELVQTAKQECDSVIVLVGSCNIGRSIYNPFPFEMVRDSIIEDRVSVIRTDDFFHDKDWISSIIKILYWVRTTPDTRYVLYGFEKDSLTSQYLNFVRHYFDEYRVVNSREEKIISSTEIRNHIFDKIIFELNGLSSIKSYVPERTLKMLADFIHNQQIEFQKLQEEYTFVQNYKKTWTDRAVYTTVDCVVRVFNNDKIVLVKRKDHPGKGQLALPGGFLEPNLGIRYSLAKELKEEIGLHIQPDRLKYVLTNDRPKRDVRGSIMTHLFTTMIHSADKLKAGDDASSIVLLSPDELNLTELYADHKLMIREYLKGGY